jgi:microcystin-dependent protein
MDPFVAEIRLFAGNFAPNGWAFCNGQLMSIAQNTALFSLLGTTYGGDGMSTFALPNLQGRAPMHPGQGPGLSLHDLGETGGAETVALVGSEIPTHTHTLNVSTQVGTEMSPTDNYLAASPVRSVGYAASANTSMNAGVGTPADPHNNMQPYLALNFIIALQGVFPPRP